MLVHAYLTHCELASLDFTWTLGESGNFQHLLGEHRKKRETIFVEHWKTMWIHIPFFAGIIHRKSIQGKNTS